MKPIEILFLLFIIVVSLLSKIPFIAINMLLPFPIEIVWLCVVFNVISWFLLEVWALGLDIGFFIEKAKLNTLTGFFTALLIVSLALISQIPNVFPAIQYNPKEFSIEIAICVLIALSFFPIKSLILTVDYYYSDKEKERKLKAYKDSALNQTRTQKLSRTGPTFEVINKQPSDFSGLINIIGKFVGFSLVFFYEWFNVEYSFSKAIT